MNQWIIDFINSCEDKERGKVDFDERQAVYY